MDSLFFKIGSLRSLVPASTGRPCEGSSDISQAPPRPVQVCACKSPSPSQVKSSVMAVSTPPAEESMSTNGSPLASFNPLPLLSSHSAIPVALKFLWFPRNSHQATETRDRDPVEPEHSGREGEGEESVLLNDTGAGFEGKGERALRELQVDVHGLMAKKETLDESIVDVDGLITEKETLNEFDSEDVDSCSACERDASSSDTPETQNPDDTSTPDSHKKGWFFKIADIGAFWPDPNILKEQRNSTHAPSPELESVPFSSSTSGPEASWDTHRMAQSLECEANEGTCNLDATLGCSLEVPYTRVLHTKESFAKFLQDASLYDMKVFAQLAFLSDMAYMIPDIQPGQLMKYHHLKLVTSSLVKKAEIESKVKEGESMKKSSTHSVAKPTLSVENGRIQSNLEPSSSNFCSQSESNPGQSSEASHMNTHHSSSSAAPDLSCRTEEQRASSIPQIDVRQVRSILSLLEPLEEKKSIDKDSLMDAAPVMAVMLAEEETKLSVTKDHQSARSSPCEWFVCDELNTYTRMFVIQGSESLASWQANLFFEPTKFEGLDVFVHRGIYEAANALYDEVLPEVLAHISTHSDLAQARFTGHSLGGSLATLLALMFQIRGVLPSTAILPVVTFGSPCIMCGGDYLLQKLKLPVNHIQSVIMHRDVVPRAFACDYPDHVAEVLKRLNTRFRDHPCLNNQKLLYAPMGQILILQPEKNVAPSHPLLPDGRGLYVLRHPINGSDVENATELRGAQRAFLNMPHPLDILSDPGAYGFDGAVSRDHDPRSYSKAIHVVLKQEVKRLRRVQREQRRQFWWPSVIAESSSLLRNGIRAGRSLDNSRASGALSSNVGRRTSSLSKPPVNYATTNHIGFLMRGGSILESHKDAFSRFTRLIASRHVQMGVLLALSLRVVILGCLSTLFVWV
eukprot:c24860_g1_i1 orf=683-3415(+)